MPNAWEPLWWFSKVRDTLGALTPPCSCERQFPAGATTDATGKPSPAVYAFIRTVNGETLFGTVVVPNDDESELVPENERRALCVALNIDPSILGLDGPIH